MACFADINVSQGSVATYGRCGRIFHKHLTANIPGKLPVRNFVNQLRVDRIMVMSLWPRFLAHPDTAGAFPDVHKRWSTPGYLSEPSRVALCEFMNAAIVN